VERWSLFGRAGVEVSRPAIEERVFSLWVIGRSWPFQCMVMDFASRDELDTWFAAGFTRSGAGLVWLRGAFWVKAGE